MKIANNKTMTLAEAIQLFVKDGNHISIGGFTINRNPMAAVYEIIRQKKRNLHLYAHSNGQGADELIGGGCIDKIEIAYSGTGRFGPTCIRFRKAIEKNMIKIEDYSNFQMTLRFMAGALGIPYLPTRSGLGTDIVRKWGFDKKMRDNDSKIPNHKLMISKNPFKDWLNTEELVLVPAIQTDVAIIHVQKADYEGTASIKGLTFADIEQAKAAAHVIITCEELLDKNEMHENSDHNQIPPFIVDAVVHVPYGAYPTACYGHYDYDPQFLKVYAKLASTDSSYKGYVNKFIHSTKNHESFLALAGNNIDKIKADPKTGYATNLDRV